MLGKRFKLNLQTYTKKYKDEIYLQLGHWRAAGSGGERRCLRRSPEPSRFRGGGHPWKVPLVEGML